MHIICFSIFVFVSQSTPRTLTRYMGAPVFDSLRRGREGEREEGKRGRSEASTNKREREREKKN